MFDNLKKFIKEGLLDKEPDGIIDIHLKDEKIYYSEYAYRTFTFEEFEEWLKKENINENKIPG